MKSVLIRRGGGLGDFLAVVPVIHLLRRRFPGIRIGIQCAARHIPLTRLLPVDEVIDEDSLPIWNVRGDRPLPESISDIWSGWNEIIAYVNPDSEMAMALGRCVESTVRICRPMPEENGPGMYRHAASVLTPFPNDPEWSELMPPLLKVDRFDAGREGRRLVIHAGAGSSTKRWDSGHIHEVVKRLRQSGPFGIDWIVGPADRSVDTIGMPIGSDCRILNNIPLDQLVGCIGRASAFLGNDSGPAHLAGLLGVRGIVMFGPTNPRIWRPFGQTLETMDFSSRASNVALRLAEVIHELTPSPIHDNTQTSTAN